MTLLGSLRVVFLSLQLAEMSQADSGCRYCDVMIICDMYAFSTCCIDANFSLITQPRRDCVSTIYITDKNKTIYRAPYYRYFHKKVWMIAQCMTNWDNNTVKNLCENQNIEDDIELFTPVYNNGDHYRNKYCAQCNDVNDLSTVEPWSVEIYCNANLSLSPNLLTSIKRRQCNIFVKPPAEYPVSPCDKVYNSTSECTLTARISKEVEGNETCGDHLSGIHKSDYFCYDCESESSPMLNDHVIGCTGQRSVDVGIIPPFAAILDINVIKQEGKKDQEHCDVSIQIYDSVSKTCRDLYCDDRRYVWNGRCLLGLSGQYEYGEMQLYYIKLTPQPPWENIPEDMLEQTIFQTNLQDFINSTILKATIFHLRVFRTIFNTTDESFLLIQIVIGPESSSTDMVSYIFLNVHSHTFELFPAINFTAEMVMHNISFDETFNPGKYLNIATQFDTSLLHLESITSQNETFLNLSYLDYYYFEQIHKLSVCPYVKVQFSDIEMTIDNNFLTIKSDFFEVTLNGWDFKIVSDTGIIFCLEDFLKVNDASFNMRLPNDADNTSEVIHPKAILAFICVCLSIVCLLITLTTYFIFPSLHSQPGINNMILCVSLLLAQTFYQFGADQTLLPDWACAVIGAFCHFFWLAVMFSMNICSVDMYLVFKKLTKLPPKFELAHTLRNLMYVVCSSMLFVLLNLVVSFILSKGKDSGYGGSLCYLSSPVLQTVTFVIPSAVMVIANIVLFVLVVFNINAASIGSANLNQERNFLGIYTRLSSIVGLTWLFGFVQLLVRNEILEYIFIVFNASQGVFIMVAFVINKRTLSLYCKGKGKQGTTGTNSTEIAVK